MRKKIVAGNWKMNLKRHEALALADAVCTQSVQVNGVVKIVFPPFPYLHSIAAQVGSDANLHVGAQNCSSFQKGAYTGEVAADMIASCGAAYVLIGHSERRQYFTEDSIQLIEKINCALDARLKVIFCFGEMKAERDAQQQFAVVKEQLISVLKSFPKNRLEDLILAYEPVWAIGTGLTASPAQAQEMHAYVREVLAELFGAEAANNLSILYGGSCNAQNAKELFAQADVDGGLIGGASLKAEDFCTIMTSF